MTTYCVIQLKIVQNRQIHEQKIDWWSSRARDVGSGVEGNKKSLDAEFFPEWLTYSKIHVGEFIALGLSSFW